MKLSTKKRFHDTTGIVKRHRDRKSLQAVTQTTPKTNQGFLAEALWRIMRGYEVAPNYECEPRAACSLAFAMYCSICSRCG